jgi:hypothetical protein
MTNPHKNNMAPSLIKTLPRLSALSNVLYSTELA